MPTPLVSLGLLFVLYAIFPIIGCIVDGYWSGLWTTLCSIVTKNYKMCLAIILLVILLIFFVDLPLAKLCQKYYHQSVYTVFDFFCSLAEGYFVLGVLVSLSLIYTFFNKYNHVIVLKMSYMAAIYAGLLNSILKFLFNRQRPNIGLNQFNFFHFFLTKEHDLKDILYAYNSMPSGHTIIVFAAILPLWKFVDKPIYKVLLGTFGVIIAVARVYTMNHWCSDVFVSSILGSIIGLSVYEKNSHRLSQR